jgi:pimeloyl-ACP methyl ester carboxylesterase
MSKAKLVFLPGMLCTRACFEYQARHLEDIASCQIIPLDQGQTIAECAAWVLEQCPAEMVLVGFSQGAVVALEIMRQAKERISKLCLLAADGRGSSARQLQTWQSWREQAHSTAFHDYVESFSQQIFDQQDIGTKNLIKDMAYSVGRDAFVRQLEALSSRADSLASLNGISCPTLIVAGREDKLTPLKLSHEIHQHVGQSTLIPIEDCGHYLPLEQPQTVTALLRYFLLH